MSKLQIGVMALIEHEIEQEMKKVRDFGLSSCQISCWDVTAFTDENVRLVKDGIAKYDLGVTALWAGYPGHAVWDFLSGPSTIGFVPPETRAIRVDALKKAADFTKACGLTNIITHAGFMPENPNDPLYKSAIEALKEIAQHAEAVGIGLNFETGQETPITLLRMIKDIGTANLGVNIDPANLLMYGKANPIDALDILGTYVRGVHAKDGEYPTEPGKLGVEKPLGEGRVNFPAFIAKLKSFGYSGALTIEREISGPQQIEDIKKAIRFLEPLC